MLALLTTACETHSNIHTAARVYDTARGEFARGRGPASIAAPDRETPAQPGVL
jgi:hypothetical protein